jgi:RNA polymerase sigma-70 factor (ECF subfamily)
MSSDSLNAKELARLRGGGVEEVASLFSQYEERLRKMVHYRLDRRLYGRVDAADVLQEAYLEAARRIDDYLARPDVPFFVWLRQITAQVLIDTHRRHLAKMRSANQEVRLHRGAYVHATSFSLAAQLVGKLTSPSRAAMREEMLVQVRAALDGMDELDREVLALRHFEELTNNEVAEVLGLQKAAASNRYVRALKRLRGVLEKLPLFAEEREAGE